MFLRSNLRRSGLIEGDEPYHGTYVAAIEGIVYGDDTGQGYVRGRTFFHAGLGVGFTVPEGFVIDNTSEAVLATG